MPAAPAARQLDRARSPLAVVGWALAAGSYGALAAWGLQDTAPALWADRALVLAGLGALPAPVALLSGLTTPTHAVTRRFLGQTGASIFSDAVRSAWLLVATLLAVPAGFLLASFSLGLDAVAAQRGAAVLSSGVLGAAIASMTLLAAAMATIAAGTQGAWRAAAGVGFGPPEVAPLLYAPALAFLAGLIPAALLTALWNAAPQVLSAERAWAATAIVLVGSALSARRRCARLAPQVHRALLVIEQAHATPFALAEEAPQPPRWLAAQETSVQFLGRAWVRRYPASLFVSVLIALAATLAVGPKTAPESVVILCFAATLYAGTRGLGLLLAGPELSAAAAWLGGRSDTLRAAERSLALRLTTPAITAIAAGWTSGAWGGAAAGLLGGAVTAALLVRLGHRAVAVWAGRLGLAAAMLLVAGLG